MSSQEASCVRIAMTDTPDKRTVFDASTITAKNLRNSLEEKILSRYLPPKNMIDSDITSDNMLEATKLAVKRVQSRYTGLLATMVSDGTFASRSGGDGIPFVGSAVTEEDKELYRTIQKTTDKNVEDRQVTRVTSGTLPNSSTELRTIYGWWSFWRGVAWLEFFSATRLRASRESSYR